MTRTRAVLAATSLVTAAALLVAGCADGPQSSPRPAASSASTKPSPSPSPSPSPTAKAVVVAPERPQALDDDGPAGAEAAAVYFLELDDYIMKTGDTAEWEAMSHKSCTYCANRLDQAREITKRGDIFTGGDAKVRVTQTYAQDSTTGIWPLDVRIDEKASTITSKSGRKLFHQDASEDESRVEVARSRGHWTVLTVAEIPGS
ncbi:DUF6318 family protein [Isoptericola sp. NPDC055881]